MFTIIARKVAHARGDKRFFTGKPCKHGHLDERWVSTGSCLSCLRSYREGFKAGDFRALGTVGLKPVTFAVHPDDIPILQSIASELAFARRAAADRAKADDLALFRARIVAGGAVALATVVKVPDVECE